MSTPLGQLYNWDLLLEMIGIAVMEALHSVTTRVSLLSVLDRKSYLLGRLKSIYFLSSCIRLSKLRTPITEGSSTMVNFQPISCTNRAYDKDSIVYYPVLVVAARAAGAVLGYRSKEKLGFDRFRIFDR